MEETLLEVVLWTWLVGMGVWGYFFVRQGHWQLLASSFFLQLRRSSWAVAVLLAVGMGVVLLYHPGALRTHLWPFEALNHPLVNRTGLLVMRISIFWTVFMLVHRERLFRSVNPKMQTHWLSCVGWVRFYNRHYLIGIVGLCSGLFITLSSAATALLCALAWAVSTWLWNVLRVPR